MVSSFEHAAFHRLMMIMESTSPKAQQMNAGRWSSALPSSSSRTLEDPGGPRGHFADRKAGNLGPGSQGGRASSDPEKEINSQYPCRLLQDEVLLQCLWPGSLGHLAPRSWWRLRAVSPGLSALVESSLPKLVEKIPLRSTSEQLAYAGQLFLSMERKMPTRDLDLLLRPLFSEQAGARPKFRNSILNRALQAAAVAGELENMEFILSQFESESTGTGSKWHQEVLEEVRFEMEILDANSKDPGDEGYTSSQKSFQKLSRVAEVLERLSAKERNPEEHGGSPLSPNRGLPAWAADLAEAAQSP